MYVTVFNAVTTPVYLGDCYTTVPLNGSIFVKRTVSEFAKMKGLHKKMIAGEVALGIECNLEEGNQLRSLDVFAAKTIKKESLLGE